MAKPQHPNWNAGVVEKGNASSELLHDFTQLSQVKNKERAR